MIKSKRKQIEKQAVQVLTDSGALRVPVPIDRVVHHMKLSATATNFGDDVSGILVVEKKRAAIGYNMSHAPVRQRFTIAHEIGHYVLHAKNSAQSHLFIDKHVTYRRDGLSSTGNDQQEVEANAFAAALLMPEKLIRKEIEKQDFDLDDDDDIDKLAKIFNVSTTAMANRLANLELLREAILLR